MTRAALFGPGNFRKPTPGYPRLSVPVGEGDRYEVAERWRDWPWFATLVYLGCAQGKHWFERLPDGAKP
jgi:hypothetical protein